MWGRRPRPVEPGGRGVAPPQGVGPAQRKDLPVVEPHSTKDGVEVGSVVGVRPRGTRVGAGEASVRVDGVDRGVNPPGGSGDGGTAQLRERDDYLGRSGRECLGR